MSNDVRSTQFPYHGMGWLIGIAYDSYDTLAQSAFIASPLLHSRLPGRPPTISQGRCLTSMEGMW